MHSTQNLPTFIKRLLFFWTSGGPEVENSPASAQDAGLISWSGEIPYAAGQLGPGATATEFVL